MVAAIRLRTASGPSCDRVGIIRSATICPAPLATAQEVMVPPISTLANIAGATIAHRRGLKPRGAPASGPLPRTAKQLGHELRQQMTPDPPFVFAGSVMKLMTDLVLLQQLNQPGMRLVPRIV